VLIEQTQGDRDRERETIAALGPHMVDGAIVSPQAVETADVTMPGVPVVLLGEHPLALPLDHVGIDNVTAAHTATRHLLDLGRRRIAVIGQHPTRGTATQRLAGYRQALREAGLPETVASALRYHHRDGAEAMTELLALPEPPDAVFCFNDMLALGAIRAAVDHGLRVPADLAVVGFDNSDHSAYSVPALTTIAPDKAALAKAAVDLVHRRASGDTDFPPQDVRIPFALEVRESSTP
jgi:DNA-binding LacI/PurR family transcriptional regulator